MVERSCLHCGEKQWGDSHALSLHMRQRHGYVGSAYDGDLADHVKTRELWRCKMCAKKVLKRASCIRMHLSGKHGMEPEEYEQRWRPREEEEPMGRWQVSWEGKGILKAWYVAVCMGWVLAT